MHKYLTAHMSPAPNGSSVLYLNAVMRLKYATEQHSVFMQGLPRHVPLLCAEILSEICPAGYNSLEAEGIPDRYIKMQPTLFQDMDSTREKLMQLQDRSSGEESSEIDDEGYLKMNHLNR